MDISIITDIVRRLLSLIRNNNRVSILYFTVFDLVSYLS